MVKKKKAYSPLTRKLIRDLREGWKSFLAILIICVLSVTLYMGIDATWRCIERSVEKQFLASDMADIWVNGAVGDRVARDIKGIPGVKEAQRRVLLDGTAKGLDGAPAFTLIMNEGDAIINKPLLWGGSGDVPRKKNEVFLQTEFANEHQLSVGDILRITIGDRVLDLTICGTGTMPEYVVASSGNEMAVPPTRFGYGFVTAGTLDFAPYTQVAVQLFENADLNAVKAQIETLFKEKAVVITNRDDVPGIKMAIEEAQQIRDMNGIFPVVFFVIAALITWTTMGRLVENQRLQIGSLLALGYSRRELLWHYAGYGLFLAGGGSVLGLIGARYAIAPLLMYFLRTAYILPGEVPHLDILSSAIVVGIIALITGGAGLLSARTALKMTPAGLLRPKPPGKGKRVVLENIGPVWQRISFSSKMILRNLLRNPVRVLMGMIGAMGCTALMLTGFGLRDSVDYVMTSHYTRTMRYDARVVLKQDAPSDYGKAIALRAGAESYEEQMMLALDAQVKDEWHAKAVYVLENNHDKMWLYDGEGARISLPESGAVLSKKAAEDMGLEDAESLTLRLPGERPLEIPIVGLVELQLDQGIYFSRAAWENLKLMPFIPNQILLSGGALDLQAADGMDGVEKIRTLKDEQASNEKILEILNIIVVILVLFSGVLAFVVFYNLGQLNFSERIRELATLKVLGFTPREIKKLVLRENIIITLMGLPFGMIAGPLLHYTVLTYGLPHTIQFSPYIALTSWGITIAMTIVFAMLVNWMLGAKFKEVNMVESLKSVE